MARMNKVIVSGQDFGPTYEKMEPFFIQRLRTDEDNLFFETAKKAIYLFMCNVVKGLDTQIRALDLEDQKLNERQETPWRNSYDKAIAGALVEIQNKRGDMRFTVIQIGILQEAADRIMDQEVESKYKCRAWWCPCC